MTSADLRELPASAVDSDAGEPLDPRRRLALLHECRDLVIAQLTRFIGEALDRLSIELTITAMKAAGRESQQALLDALSLVRVHRNDIEYRFRQSFAEIFEQRLYDRGPPSAQRNEVASTIDELALVDDGAIDDRIALDRLVRRARRQLDPDEVLGVRARLAALLDREWFDEDDYPASPELVFEALQRSLDELEPPAQVRTALLQAFEPHVAASLADVHASVNERLRQQVLPTIRPRAFPTNDPQRPGSSAAEASRADSTAATAPGVQSGVHAAAGAGPGTGSFGSATHGVHARGAARGGMGSGGGGATGGGAAGRRATASGDGAGFGDVAAGGGHFDLFDGLVQQLSLDQAPADRKSVV